MSPPKTQRSVFLNYRNAAKNLSSVSVNNLKNILRRFKESGLNVNGSFAANIERMIERKGNWSLNTWNTRTKEAARTIKRIVTKKYAQKKYENYRGPNYGRIRRGLLPKHTSALQRRARIFPTHVNSHLYRGISNFSKNQILQKGYLVNKSFSSFSKSREIAKSFSGNVGVILVLPPGKYPAINSEKFTGNRREREVTIAPGIYTVNGLTNSGNIRVTYKPLR